MSDFEYEQMMKEEAIKLGITIKEPKAKEIKTYTFNEFECIVKNNNLLSNDELKKLLKILSQLDFNWLLLARIRSVINLLMLANDVENYNKITSIDVQILLNENLNLKKVKEKFLGK